jgi:hypothetical protein
MNSIDLLLDETGIETESNINNEQISDDILLD